MPIEKFFRELVDRGARVAYAHEPLEQPETGRHFVYASLHGPTSGRLKQDAVRVLLEELKRNEEVKVDQQEVIEGPEHTQMEFQISVPSTEKEKLDRAWGLLEHSSEPVEWFFRSLVHHGASVTHASELQRRQDTGHPYLRVKMNIPANLIPAIRPALERLRQHGAEALEEGKWDLQAGGPAQYEFEVSTPAERAEHIVAAAMYLKGIRPPTQEGA